MNTQTYELEESDRQFKLIIWINIATLAVMATVLVLMVNFGIPDSNSEPSPVVRVETDKHIIVQNGERVISVTEKEDN